MRGPGAAPPRGVKSPPRDGALHNTTTAPDYTARGVTCTEGWSRNATYSSSKSQTLFVDGNRMCISLRRYHLLPLLANNTGTIAAIAMARTSARLDKTCITNRLRVIPECSAVKPCLPSPGRRTQDEAGMCHLSANWAERRCGKAPHLIFIDAVFKFQHRRRAEISEKLKTDATFSGPKTFQHFQKSTWKTTPSDTGYDITKG